VHPTTERRTTAIPRRALAVLVGSIVTIVAIELVVATLDYRAWEAFYRTTEYEFSASEVLGPLSSYRWVGVQMTWLPVMLTIVGFSLARRGRRWLFAGPAVAIFAMPLLVAFFQGNTGSMLPEFDAGYGRLAFDHGQWVTWLGSSAELLVVILPGLVVARHVKGVRNPFQVPAVLMLAVPALVIGYLGILLFSPSGHLESGQAAEYAAAFLFAAAMGFDRPVWPWVLVAMPGLVEGLPALVLAGEGNEVVLIALIALLGASSVPFSRILYRGWQENMAPGSPHESDSLAG